MDPVANIVEQRELAAKIFAELDGPEPADSDTVWDSAERLAELVLALDEWRRKGGFDPYIQTRADSLKARSSFLERERRELGNRRRQE